MAYHVRLTNCGFTLIEIVVALFSFSIVILGVVALVSNVLVTADKQGQALADTDQARKALFRLADEVRNAVTSSSGAYPIALADSQELIFYANVDGGSDVERVRYFLQQARLMRGVIKPSGNPPAYQPGSESVSVVQQAVMNGSSPLFYYYDDTYNGVTENPLAQPVNITRVRYIRLEMKIQKRAGIQNTASYTVTAGAAIRNLKTNLGN